MKRVTKWALGGSWTFLVSAALTKLWLSWPQMFPQVPHALAERLVHAYGATDAEGVADLEILLGFAVFIPLVGLGTYLVWRLVSRTRAH